MTTSLPQQQSLCMDQGMAVNIASSSKPSPLPVWQLLTLGSCSLQKLACISSFFGAMRVTSSGFLARDLKIFWAWQEQHSVINSV
jgi:hypothetical protein